MKKISFIIFCIMVMFLPFAALLGNILEFHTSIPNSQVFWITHWYEVLLPILLVGGVYSAIKNKKIFSWSHYLAITLIVYSIILVILLPGLSRSLEGFRFTVLSVVFFIIAALINLTKEEKNKIVKIYLIVSVIIACWALIERFLPNKYWNIFLIDPNIIFGWGWHGAGGFMQSASVLGGPNQLASYLLPALFLVVFRIQNTDNSKTQESLATCYILLATIIAAAIILSQSRSAIVGLIVGFLIYIYLINKNKFIRYGFSGLLLVAAVLLAFLYQTNINFRTIATHGGQTGHQTALIETMREIKDRAINNPTKLIFGSGLGTAGPLALKYGDGFISESWYLQLLLETGIIGLIVWLWFIVELFKELLKKKENGLFLGLFSVSIAAIFLHTWADNPAISYTLFILLGLALGESKNEKNTN